VIPEEDEARRKRTPHEEEQDTLAERRARRAWLGDAALLRRAEAAEESVRTLEAHLADLRGRQAESERVRESTTVQLAERELELRRVKQREYAEQQLRVEAEEAAVRARGGHRAERDRWRRRVEEAQAAAQYAEEQRDALAARLATVNESCERLREGVVALQGVAGELRTTFEHDHGVFRTRIGQLESELELARAKPSTGQGSATEEAQRREEMAGALAAAVSRLRARAVPAPSELAALEAPAPVGLASSEPSGARQSPAPAPAAHEASPPPALPAAATLAPPATPQEIPTVVVVPRLFVGAGRLRPVARRIAARLAAWAGPAQESRS
jgi:chromosome segregation ATPase